MTDSSPNGKPKREFYLNRTDAAEELGISYFRLTALTKAVGVGTCGKGRGCHYTAADIRRLRGVASLMTKYPISAKAAARIQADIDANKAAQGQATTLLPAGSAVAERTAR